MYFRMRSNKCEKHFSTTKTSDGSDPEECTFLLTLSISDTKMGDNEKMSN